MNEGENCLRRTSRPCIAMVVNSSHHTSLHRVSLTNWEFHVLLYENVKHKKWHPVLVPLAWSVCVVICTETQIPGSSDHINNQMFVEISTARSDRIVT